MMKDERLHRLQHPIAQTRLTNNNWRRKLGHTQNIYYQMVILYENMPRKFVFLVISLTGFNTI